MDIVISSGHGKYIRGASGYLDEVDEARRVVDRVAELLEAAGVGVVTFHDNTSTTQSTNLNTIVAFHNKQSRDLDVSVHLNAYQTTSKPMGTEVLYVTQAALASEVSDAIAQAGDFIDRGPKKRTDLAFLNGTHEPAILIEVCFVDSKADEELYQENFEEICSAIASALSGEELVPVPEPPTPEPEPIPPGAGVVHNLTEGDLLNIRAEPNSISAIIGTAANGDILFVVGSTMTSSTKWLKCSFGTQDGQGVSVFGWASAAYVQLEDEEAAGEWHDNITATIFGHGDDAQESAYGGWIDEHTVGVSFPYKWRDQEPPRIVVDGPGGAVECDVVDVGPWNTDDPDYVLGTARPLSETQYANQTKAQNGMVPTNDAGIDLTLPVAEAVGVSVQQGRGKVRWKIKT